MNRIINNLLLACILYIPMCFAMVAPGQIIRGPDLTEPLSTDGTAVPVTVYGSNGEPVKIEGATYADVGIALARKLEIDLDEINLVGMANGPDGELFCNLIRSAMSKWYVGFETPEQVWLELPPAPSPGNFSVVTIASHWRTLPDDAKIQGTIDGSFEFVRFHLGLSMLFPEQARYILIRFDPADLDREPRLNVGPADVIVFGLVYDIGSSELDEYASLCFDLSLYSDSDEKRRDIHAKITESLAAVGITVTNKEFGPDEYEKVLNGLGELILYFVRESGLGLTIPLPSSS